MTAVPGEFHAGRVHGPALGAYVGGAFLEMGQPFLLQSLGAVALGGTLIFGGSGRRQKQSSVRCCSSCYFLQTIAITLVTGKGDYNVPTAAEILILESLTGAALGGIAMIAVGFAKASRAGR